MIIARADRLEDSLMQRQPGPAAHIRKGHGQQGLGPRRPAVGVRPTIRPDNSLRRNAGPPIRLGSFYLRLVFHGKVHGICDKALRMSLGV